MKLTHITTVPVSLGFIRGQAPFMRKRGIDVSVVSSPGELLTRFAEEERVPVEAVPMSRSITPIGDVRAIYTLVGVLRNLQPEVVHAFTPKGGLLGMISAFVARTPIRIYNILGFPYMSATGPKRLLLKSTERISCRLAHRVFCISNSIRDVAIADGICPAEKMVVLGQGSINGLDASGRFSPARYPLEARHALRQSLGIETDDVVIGFVGRIVGDKGIHELSAAWAVLRERNPRAVLVLVGPLESQDAVSPSILRTFDTDPRVIQVGSVDDPAMYYAIFDILTLPSYREGFGYVLLEAAAMEVPTVASRIPGCVDAVEDGVTGTLVPMRDADALAEAIRMYLDDPELRERHGKAGRERVLREFRQEVIWEATYQEYCRLLREKGLPVPQPVEVEVV